MGLLSKPQSLLNFISCLSIVPMMFPTLPRPIQDNTLHLVVISPLHGNGFSTFCVCFDFDICEEFTSVLQQYSCNRVCVVFPHAVWALQFWQKYHRSGGVRLTVSYQGARGVDFFLIGDVSFDHLIKGGPIGFSTVNLHFPRFYFVRTLWRDMLRLCKQLAHLQIFTHSFQQP